MVASLLYLLSLAPPELHHLDRFPSAIEAEIGLAQALAWRDRLMALSWLCPDDRDHYREMSQLMRDHAITYSCLREAQATWIRVGGVLVEPLTRTAYRQRPLWTRWMPPGEDVKARRARLAELKRRLGPALWEAGKMPVLPKE